MLCFNLNEEKQRTSGIEHQPNRKERRGKRGGDGFRAGWPCSEKHRERGGSLGMGRVNTGRRNQAVASGRRRLQRRDAKSNRGQLVQ